MSEHRTAGRMPEMVSGICSRDPRVLSMAKRKGPWDVVGPTEVSTRPLLLGHMSELQHNGGEKEASSSENSSDSEDGFHKRGGTTPSVPEGCGTLSVGNLVHGSGLTSTQQLREKTLHLEAVQGGALFVCP